MHLCKDVSFDHGYVFVVLDFKWEYTDITQLGRITKLIFCYSYLFFVCYFYKTFALLFVPNPQRELKTFIIDTITEGVSIEN